MGVFAKTVSAIVSFLMALFSLFIPGERSVINNISYGSSSRQSDDLYLPDNAEGSIGVIVLIHGGAWYTGDKKEMNSLFEGIRKLGEPLACVKMNYRLISVGGDVVCDYLL